MTKMNTKIGWWWLSYADEDEGFRGVVIVAAEDFPHACQISAAMGLSPGGQVAGVEVNWGSECIITLSKTFMLLDKEQSTALSKLIDTNYGKYARLTNLHEVKLLCEKCSLKTGGSKHD